MTNRLCGEVLRDTFVTERVATLDSVRICETEL